MILHHSLDVQILDGYDLVFVNQSAREFVQPILARIGCVLMRLCNKDSGFVSGVTPFHFARKFLLFTLQVLRGSRQVSRIIKLRSVAGNSKMRKANINADDFSAKGYVRQIRTVFSQHRSEVMPGLVAAHCDRLDRANDFTMHHSLDMPDLRQENLTPFNNPHALRVLDRLLAVLRFEVRVFRPALEEVHECAGHIQAYGLKNLAMRFSKPFIFFLEFWKSLVQRKLSQAFTCFLIHLLRFGKTIVPQPTRTAERLSKRFLLLGIGEKGTFGGVNLWLV